MEIQQDFKELFELFNAHNVAYVIVGGYAVAFHGAPRFTGDIDVYIQPAADNAKRVLGALAEFGFGGLGLSIEDFTKLNNVIQLGVPPVRIDIITSLAGVSWEEAFQGNVPGMYGDCPVSFLGMKELVKSKQGAGRKKDLADLESLGEE